MQVQYHTENVQGDDHVGVVIRLTLNDDHHELVYLYGQLPEDIQQREPVEQRHKRITRPYRKYYFANTESEQANKYSHLKPHQAQRTYY